MRIGIVLSSVPGYSETFFRSKIAGLYNEGYEVFIFASNNKKISVKGAKIINTPIVNRRNPILQVIKAVISYLMLLFSSPRQTYRFIANEINDGSGIVKILEKVYLNSHILGYSLDWLHFGFATTVLGHENIAKAIGAKMAVSVRGFDIAIYPLKHPGCYDNVWGKVDKIHVISDDLKKKLYYNGFKDNAPVVKITPAININNFFFERKEYSGYKVVNILSVGRLHWKKGLEYGLQSLAKLKERGIAFRYVVIGGGEELERLKFVTYQLGIEKEVEFKGILTSEETAMELKSADLYIQPSIQEGFCNAVLEAQAAGCLCVVSDAEGLPENVLHEKTGWVVKRRDTVGFANMLEDVIGLPVKKKQEIIEAAQTRVRDDFNVEKQISEFVDFYS